MSEKKKTPVNDFSLWDDKEEDYEEETYVERVISAVKKKKQEGSQRGRVLSIYDNDNDDEDKTREKKWMIATQRAKWHEGTMEDLMKPLWEHPKRMFTNEHDIVILTRISKNKGYMECDYNFIIPKDFQYKTRRGKKKQPPDILKNWFKYVDGSHTTTYNEESRLLTIRWRAIKDLNQFTSNDNVIKWFFKNINEVIKIVVRFNKKIDQFKQKKAKKK